MLFFSYSSFVSSRTPLLLLLCFDDTVVVSTAAAVVVLTFLTHSPESCPDLFDYFEIFFHFSAAVAAAAAAAASSFFVSLSLSFLRRRRRRRRRRLLYATLELFELDFLTPHHLLLPVNVVLVFLRAQPINVI